MQLNDDQIKAINEEVMNFLSDLKEQVDSQSVTRLGIDFSRIHREDLLSEAADSLASGDMLKCIIMHCMDGMSMFNDNDD